MRILFSSAVFYPRTGGIERITQALAEGAVERGHEVVVATQEPNPKGDEPFPFRVVRQPGGWELHHLARRSDVVVFGGTSLHALWPVLVARRPIVTGHHNWYQTPGKKRTWSGWLKIRASQFSWANIACSTAIARQLPVACEVVGSFYDDSLFYAEPGIERSGDLIAVGRFVSDKGFDVLIEAVGLLARAGSPVRLALVGDGPERDRLEDQARRLDVTDAITFHGHKEGAELRRLLCAHRVLVVPSRWPEPFGIVVGEGLACGCAVIGSDRGGLPEAMGPCGLPFRSEDADDLAGVIQKLMTRDDLRESLLAQSPSHLEPLKKSRAVPRYLELIEAVARA